MKPSLILSVDDNPEVLQIFHRYLTAEGYEVRTASSGPNALEQLRTLKPDLILLDVDMPEMDGFEVCLALQRDPRLTYTPVVFVTARDADQDQARAFSVGAADYLVKPVKKELLLATVRKHLETRSRWYQVSAATDLWDVAPLPQKFVEFREYLIKKLRVGPEAVAALEQIKSSDIYLFTKHMDLTYEELAQHMASFFGMEYIPRVKPETIQLGVLPTAFCKTNHVVAIRDEEGADAIVIINPFAWGLAELDILNNAFRGGPYRLLVTHRQGMRSLFANEAPGQTPSASGDHEVNVLEDEKPRVSVDKLMEVAHETSAIDIVNALIADAVRRRASDLHIQPGKERVQVRYRVDGRLRQVMPLQSTQLPAVVARLKIMCNMDMTESRMPQDGGCKVRVDGQEMELRASTLPSTHGEKVVLRIVSQNSGMHQLDSLGFEPGMLRELRSLLAARQGMLLITGPTGSGKTTSLYAALTHLNKEEVNILTVEDPVEIDLEGITQVQVHDRAGRSFANTLRAMLRQDPDIIMLGEIRDLETAEIACRAALTGHLVLSTLHTQHTLGTLVRLLDMGVPAYLAASALNGVLAQRLAHRVCEECAVDYDPSSALKTALRQRFGSLDGARFRRGQGCARCQRRGTHGRRGIYELLLIDDDLRHLMAEGAAPSVLREHVAERGFRTLEEDAFQKACAGLIPPEEIVELGFGVAMAMAAMGEAPEPPALAPPPLPAADLSGAVAMEPRPLGVRRPEAV